MLTQTHLTIEVQPLTAQIGAVVEGLDLRQTIDISTVATIESLLAAHQVLFVRGQYLDHAELAALASRFGRPTVHPLRAMLGDDRAVSTIVDDAGRPPAGFDWHTDLSWLESPPRVGFLNAVEIPSHGGDTLWASMHAAHAALSAPVQALCAQVSGVHRIDRSFQDTIVRNHGVAVAEQLAERHPEVLHPLVRYDANGAPSLFLSPLYLDRIDGLHRSESDALLALLDSLIEDPHQQVRWRWQPGDLAIWNEATTVHRALTDHGDRRRVMRRCTVDVVASPHH